MSNDFYVSPADLAPGTKARAGDINTIDQSVDAAFDKLPSEIALKTGTVTYAQNTSKAANAYAVALSPKVTTAWPIDGLQVTMLPVLANTGACTLNVNGLGNIAIKRQDGGDPIAGDLAAASPITLTYVASSNVFVLPSTANGQVAAAQAAAQSATQSATSASTSAGSAAGSAGSAAGSAGTAVAAANSASGSAQAAAQSAAAASVGSFAGNLVMNGAFARIVADFTNATLSQRTMFQTSASNSFTAVGMVPSGSGTVSNLNAFNSSDLSNTAYNSIGASGTSAFINSKTVGSAPLLPISFQFNSAEAGRFDTGGNLLVGTQAATGKLTINSTTSTPAISLLGKSSTVTGADIDIARTSTDQNVGRGPAIQFDDTSNAAFSKLIQMAQGSLQFYSLNPGYWVEQMRLSPAGYLGINTTNPSLPLDVSGGIGGSFVTARSSFTSHGQGAWLEWNKGNGDGATYLMNQRGGGSGGIKLGEVDTANGVTILATFLGGTLSLPSDLAAGKASVITIGSNGAYNNITVAGDAMFKGIDDTTPVVLGEHNGSSIRCSKTSITMRPNNATSDGLTLDTSNNLAVGNSGAVSAHALRKGVTTGGMVLGIGPAGGDSHRFYVCDTAGASAATCAYSVDKINATGRSINAAGFISASGNDYAEYMHKSDACGDIPKGAIVGISADGLLVDKWADAVSFLIKSTDPSYVGGDTWGNEAAIGARPQMPALTFPEYAGQTMPGDMPTEPIMPVEPELVDPLKPVEPEAPSVIIQADATDEEIAERNTQYEAAYQDYQTELMIYASQVGANAAARSAYEADMQSYKKAMAKYEQDISSFWDALISYDHDRDAWLKALSDAQTEYETVTIPAYQAALADFEAKLEIARQCVDRMAYCGQVPVNVQGARPGQYVVPVQDGDGIGGLLVDDQAITFEQYRRAVGIVQNILPDGRANVRVKPV